MKFDCQCVTKARWNPGGNMELLCKEGEWNVMSLKTCPDCNGKGIKPVDERKEKLHALFMVDDGLGLVDSIMNKADEVVFILTRGKVHKVLDLADRVMKFQDLIDYAKEILDDTSGPDDGGEDSDQDEEGDGGS